MSFIYCSSKSQNSTITACKSTNVVIPIWFKDFFGGVIVHSSSFRSLFSTERKVFHKKFLEQSQLFYLLYFSHLKLHIDGKLGVCRINKTPIRFKKRSFMSFLKPHTHPFDLDLKPKYNCFTQIID